MVELFAERPLLLSVLLGLLAMAMLYAWTRSGQRSLLIAAAVLGLLIPVVWVVAGAIVTEEEEIRTLLARLAADVEANRFEDAYQAIHPDRTDVLQRARAELPRYEFTQARIASFRKIRVLEGTDPLEAVVDLNANVVVSQKRGPVQNQKVVRRLLLHLQKTPSGWKVIDYDHRSLIGRDAFSTGGNDLEELFRE